MSGTAAAGLERDGGGFLRGLEREMRSLSVVGIRRGIAYSENATVGVLYPVAVVRPRNASTQRRKEQDNEEARRSQGDRHRRRSIPESADMIPYQRAIRQSAHSEILRPLRSLRLNLIGNWVLATLPHWQH